MKKICIIQLTRFGDLIQTLQAARPIKIHRTDISLHLIARKQFAEPLKYLLDEVFDSITYIDAFDLTDRTLVETDKKVNTALKEINSKCFEVLINLSFSKSSSYLCSLINAQHKLGVHRNELGEIAINDKWSQYIFASVMSNTHNPFSLVDLYKNIIGCSEMTSLESKPAITRKFFKIAIHPFASDVKKSWSQYKWVEVIYYLSKHFPNHTIEILGGPSDKNACKEILTNPMLKDIKIVNSVGAKSIKEVHDTLLHSDCFIGNDSMISHLASLTTVPILTISTGPVRPHESIPYRQGAISVCSETKCFPCTVETKCDLLTCHKDISHNLVVQLCQGLIEGKEITSDYIKSKINVFHLQSVKIYKAQQSKSGALSLESLTSEEFDYREITKLANKILFELYLGNRDFHSPIPKLTNNTAQKIMEDLKIITQLYELYGHGQVFSKRLLEAIETNSDEISDLVQKIQEIERLASVTKQYSSIINVVVSFFEVSLKNSSGASLKEITQSYLVSFNDASSLTAMLFELIQQMVSPYIKAKQPERTV